jgi:hypothetical protein
MGAAVGRLIYDSTTTVEFDDRTLAHLQLVIGTKLRRGESFYLSWTDDPSIGDGRNAIWLNPGVPLRLKYNGSRRPTINMAWINQLMASANSGEGLRLVPEPPEDRQRSSEVP